MAKMIDKITVGVVAKTMTLLGYVLIDRDYQPLRGKPIYTSYGVANRVRIKSNSDLRIREVYIECNEARG